MTSRPALIQAARSSLRSQNASEMKTPTPSAKTTGAGPDGDGADQRHDADLGQVGVLGERDLPARSG